MGKEFKKIDSQGNYCSFPGFTIVASVAQGQNNFWQSLHQYLTSSKELCQFFSPLPYESYHMTLIELETANDVDEGRSWQESICDRLGVYKSIRKTLAETSFNLKLEQLGCNSFGSISLNVTLPSEQVKLIKDIANKYNLTAKIPARFHITLAYQFKHINCEHIDKYIKINKLVQRIEKRINAYLNEFSLESPQVCYFNDMKQFIPWEDDEFPFNKTDEKWWGFFANKPNRQYFQKVDDWQRCTIL